MKLRSKKTGRKIILDTNELRQKAEKFLGIREGNKGEYILKFNKVFHSDILPDLVGISFNIFSKDYDDRPIDGSVDVFYNIHTGKIGFYKDLYTHNEDEDLL